MPRPSVFMGELTRNQARVRQLLEPHDLLFIVGGDGLRMSVPGPVDPLPPGLPIVQVGTRDWELGKTYPAEIALDADVKLTLAALAPILERKRSAENSTAQAVQTEAPAERQEAQPAPKAFPGAPNAVPGARSVPEPAAVQRDLAPRKIPEAPPADLRDSAARGQIERQADKAVADPVMPAPLLAKRLEGRPPEVWIEEIRALKRAARGAEAAELLAAFRKKFPNFLLPDDLK